MDFLEELYDQGYNPSTEFSPTPTEEYLEAKQKVAELSKKVLSCMGDENSELFEDFVSAKSAQASFEFASVYAKGVKFASKFIISGIDK